MNYFMTKSLVVGKLAQIGTTAKYDYVMSVTEYDCTEAQQVSPEEMTLYGGQIGQLEKRFTEVTCPVEIGDKVVISGVTYKVKGMSRSDFGSVTYKRIVIVKTDSTADSSSS